VVLGRAPTKAAAWVARTTPPRTRKIEASILHFVVRASDVDVEEEMILIEEDAVRATLIAYVSDIPRLEKRAM
jgi:hypothetical protein